VYVIFIYTTLSVASVWWDNFNAFLGGKAVTLVFIICALIGLSVLAHMIFIKKEKCLESYFSFVFFLVIYLYLVSISRFAVDKVHLLQFGLLSVFLYNALKVDISRYDIMLYVFGVLICVLVAFFDETIQLYLPNRVFDWKDVLFDSVSSLITFLIIRINILKSSIEEGSC